MITSYFTIGFILFSAFAKVSMANAQNTRVQTEEQYFGGPEDGSAMGYLDGMRLKGKIASFSVLYKGSTGDGYDNASILASTGQPLTIYSGGNGDGTDKQSTQGTVAGSKVFLLYNGSSGDGTDQNRALVTLGSADIVTLYKGSAGDGFASDIVFENLLNKLMLSLYQGGVGDGFSESMGLNNYLNGMMLALFNGGNGDGFATDRLETTRALKIIVTMAKMNLILYPNPASAIVNFRIPSGIVIDKINVTDINGKQINIPYEPEGTLDVSTLPSGIYLLTIYAQDRKITKKLIVKK